ncbi:MAG: hypothetical protein IOC86_09630 [Aestuariivirga sp.]|nr:hypothetical protein [Aestuariivirga sp.]
MTKFLVLGAVALLAVGGLAGLASADRGGGHGGGWGHGGGMGGGMMGQEMMERYDVNKDGKITQAEIDQNRTQWHGEFDADKNTSLSLDEFRALWLKARGEMIVREFQFFDVDGNGQVTLDEYQTPMAGMVTRRDRNGDGALSQDDRGRRGKGEGMGHRRGQGMNDDEERPGDESNP